MATTGFLLIVLAGVMQGSFVLPMKGIRRWEWENAWFSFAFLGLLVLPAAVALWTIPHLFQVLAESPRSSLIAAASLGFGWGLGSACFGMGVKEVGMGLAFSIVAGLSGAFGSLIPWFRAPVRTPLGSILLWSGVLIMLGGVAVCALAGHEREKDLRAPTAGPSPQRRFRLGLGICIGGGVLSCFMNLGFVYGADVTRQAEALGADPLWAPNLLWLIVMGFGFLANGLYCGWLLWRRESWKHFLDSHSGVNLGFALLMAMIWEGNLIAYAVGASQIGDLGPSVGWAAILSVTVITSNLWGVAAGEWRGVGQRAARIMVSGVALLVLAVAILAWASTKI